jgi:hypothetical protein
MQEKHKRLGLLLAATILAMPCAAVACTCCGVDDWWSVESISPKTYGSDVVSQLRLGPGRFRVSDVDEWSISTVERDQEPNRRGYALLGQWKMILRPRSVPDHDGIDDAFLGKASEILYCEKGTWVHIPGAD